MKITDIYNSPVPCDTERALLDSKLQLIAEKDSGKSTRFIFKEGEKVIDTLNGNRGVILECYRQNGHNFYVIDPTKTGGPREKDLMRCE